MERIEFSQTLDNLTHFQVNVISLSSSRNAFAAAQIANSKDVGIMIIKPICLLNVLVCQSYAEGEFLALLFF